MSNESGRAAARDAVAVMTAWAAEPESTALLGQTMLGIVDSGESTRDLAWVNLAIGLTNLCGHLLVLRQKETGRPVGDTLRELALNYA